MSRWNPTRRDEPYRVFLDVDEDDIDREDQSPPDSTATGPDDANSRQAATGGPELGADSSHSTSKDEDDPKKGKNLLVSSASIETAATELAVPRDTNKAVPGGWQPPSSIPTPTSFGGVGPFGTRPHTSVPDVTVGMPVDGLKSSDPLPEVNPVTYGVTADVTGRPVTSGFTPWMPGLWMAGPPTSLSPSEAKQLAAYSMGRTLICSACLDVTLLVLSILTIEFFDGLWLLPAIPFAICGIVAAKIYSIALPFFLYLFYGGFVVVLRVVLMVHDGISGRYLELFLEVLKLLMQLWFIRIALMFRNALRKLNSTEISGLRGGFYLPPNPAPFVYV